MEYFLCDSDDILKVDVVVEPGFSETWILFTVNLLILWIEMNWDAQMTNATGR